MVKAREMSRVKTAACSPYGDSLAIRTASCGSLNRATGATGPKISSANAALAVGHVGQDRGVDERAPPLAAGDAACAPSLTSVAHGLLDLGGGLLGDQRADVGALVELVADGELGGLGEQGVDELVVHARPARRPV